MIQEKHRFLLIPEMAGAVPVEAVVPAVEVPVEEAVQEEVAAQEGHQWF